MYLLIVFINLIIEYNVVCFHNIDVNILLSLEIINQGNG